MKFKISYLLAGLIFLLWFTAAMLSFDNEAWLDLIARLAIAIPLALLWAFLSFCFFLLIFKLKSRGFFGEAARKKIQFNSWEHHKKEKTKKKTEKPYRKSKKRF